MGSANQTSSTSPYRVGEWEVQPSACRIVRDGREVRLTPKSMSVLDYLATRPGQTITHEELLTAFWRGAISSPNAVHKSITELRHALGIGGSGSGGEPDYIETIPRRGYRLVASVRLRRDPAESVPTERRSVAVLRFRNADDDPGHDYLAEGVAAALLECLSQTPDLIVVDRDRALHHTIGNQSVAEIGRSLDAGYLLDGTVSQVGNRVRISAALHRVSDGELVYAYQDEARIADVLQMRDKVIASVLAALEIHLDERRTNDMRDRGTRSVEAYLAMLEADSFYRRIDQRSMQFAAVRARAAIALDPGFIGAYSLLAHVLQTLHSYTPDPAARQPMRREVAQIRDAVSKQDGGSQALLDIRRLEVQMSARSWRDVEETTRAAVWAEGIPHRVCSAYVEYANLLKSGRLFREAARYLDLYRQFDKDHPRGRLQRLDLTGLTLSPRRAISVYRKALTLSQNNIGMLTTLISHLALVGEYDEAESYLCRLEESDQSTLWSYAARLQVEALRGDWRAGSVELHRVLESPRANRFTRGIVHLIVGDVAAGVEVWRQELYDPAGRGAPALLYAVYTEKYYTAAVVDDPRYQDFLDEAGIGREWTAYLREKAAELAPITGIEPGDPAPQRVWSR